MAFDPLSWAIGFSLTKGVSYFLDKIFSSDLPKKLNKDVEEWAKQLPEEIQFNHEALEILFDVFISDQDLVQFPKLKLLRDELKKFEIPTNENWYDALFERWEYIRSINKQVDLTTFYNLSADKIKPHFQILALKLHLSCIRDNDLYKINTYQDIKELRTEVHSIYEKISATGQKANTPPLFEPILEAATIQLGQLAKGLSKEIASRLEEYRELYREGRTKEAFDKVSELTKDQNWKLLDKSLRAKILKIKASYTLNLEKDLNTAKKLADEAKELDPETDDTVIRTYIKYRIDGPQSAIKSLDTTRDIDVLNFKLSLHLELGQVDEMLLALDAKPEDIVDNAETYRLSAFAYLLKGQIREAQAKVQKALFEKPKWESIRICAALIDYFSVIAPSLLPNRLPSWPDPISFDLLKQDLESVTRLENAEHLFKNLIETSEESKVHLELWYLACLASNRNKQAEAETFCRSLLTKSPENAIVVIWIIARNYAVDLSESQELFEKTSTTAKEYLLQMLALMQIYLLQGKTKDAVSLFAKIKNEFDKFGGNDTWMIWYARALLADGKTEQAIAHAGHAQNAEVKRIILTEALREVGVKSGAWEPFVEHLEKSFSDTGNGQFLYECCRLKAHLKDWGYIVKRAEELLTTIGTSSVVELIATSAWHSNNPSYCLEVLNNQADKFYKNQLPNKLQRLRVYCQKRLGMISEALTDAEILFNQNASTENLLALMEAQLGKGDLKGLAISARRLTDRRDTNPLHLLRAARLISFEDSELAIGLWRQAINIGLNETQSINEGLEIGYRLGLDKELEPLIRQMQVFSSAGEGYVKSVDFKGLLSIIEENRKRTDFVNGKYAASEIPIHLLSEALNVPLAKIYHDIPDQNRSNPDPITQPIIFIRHGGRPSHKRHIIVSSNSKLHLDITALLLCEDLGILDKVERHFKSILISPNLPSALVAQINKLSYLQPARVQGYKKLIQLLDDHKVNEFSAPSKFNQKTKSTRYMASQMGVPWVGLLENIVSEQGYLITYFPLRSKDVNQQIVELKKPYRLHVTNIRSLIKSLRKVGKISEEIFLKIIEDLGEIGREKSIGLLPKLGTSIYLEGNIACELAIADALSYICKSYKVYVDKLAVQAAKNGVKDYERSFVLINWVNKINSRIQQKINNHPYEFIKISLEATENREIGGEIKDSSEFKSLIDLFNFIPHQDEVIWIDDRFSNSFSHRDGVPIVGILDILSSLKTSKVINEKEYYSKLLQLRASNFRYIPINSKEIIYHLRNAQIINGRVVETDELAIFRRYFAACLLDSGRLQLPPLKEGMANSQGELSFITGYVHSVTDAIITIWNDADIQEENATAYSNWIFINLYTGMFGFRHLIKQDDQNNDRLDLLGLDIGSFCTQSISFSVRSLAVQKNNNRRKKYFSWIDNAMIKGRIKVDPGAIIATSRTLNHVVSDIISPKERINDSEAEPAIRKVWQLFYLDLPGAIRDEMALDENVLEWIGVNNIKSLKIGNYWFADTEFWTAVKQAAAGLTPTIKSLNIDKEFVLSRSTKIKKEYPVIKFETAGPNGPVTFNFDDPITGLLHDDPEERRKVLIANRKWIDSDSKNFERTVFEIISIENVVKRAKSVADLRNASYSVFYSNLDSKLKSSDQFSFDDLIPNSLGGILRHYRLESLLKNASAFTSQFNKTALKLIDEEGLEEALERLTCLPIVLPQFIKDKLKELSNDEQKAILNKLALRLASPTCQLHLIDLASNCIKNKSFGSEFSTELINKLFNDKEGRAHFNLFKAILLWLNSELNFAAEVRDWETPYKLVILWAHANRLHNMFAFRGAIPDELARIFESSDYQINSEIISRDLTYWNDVLHPRRVSRTSFLLLGIGNIFLNMSCDNKDPQGLTDVIRIVSNYAHKSWTDMKSLEIIAFHDPTLDRNSLGSWLGNDYGSSLSFLGNATAEKLPHVKLKAIVQNAVQEALKNPNELINWFNLYAIVNDSPIYQDLANELKLLIKKADFETMVMSSPESALWAFRVISKQAIYIENKSIKLRLEETLKRLAQTFANRKEEVASSEEKVPKLTDESIIMGLIDDALSIAMTPNNPRETSRKFFKTVEALFDIWPLTAKLFGNALFRLANELPAEQLHGIWPLILKARAMRKKE